MSRERERLYKDLKAVVHDAEALLQATADQANERVEALRDRTKASLEQARERLGALEELTAEDVQAAADEADAWVRSHPWQAVGVAAGVAFVLGLLLSRR